MNKFRILIVEDDNISMQVISMIAKKYTSEIITATNGKEGLELFKREQPDLIISDISMPIMSGLVMSQKIREINQDVPIVLASALNEADIILESIKFGVSEYIIKPLDTTKLKKILERVKSKYLLQKELDEKNKYLQIFSSALDKTNSPIIIASKNLDIEFTNKEFESLIAYEKDELLGLNFTIFLSNEEKLKFETLITSLKLDESVKQEFVIQNKIGSQFWLTVNITAILNQKSNQTYYVILMNDITASKFEEQYLLNSNTLLESKIRERTAELEFAKEKAEASAKAKGLFLAKVSHELRTPLNGILGITDILLDTEINEKQTKFLNLLKHSGKNLLRLINDILDFTKIESDKIKLKEAEFDLSEIIDELTHLYVNEIKQKNLKLDVVICDNLPKLLYGDGKKLRQVLTNLLGNAIKFTLKGEVKLSAKCDKSGEQTLILFTIEDTGIGIPEDKFDLLFKAFSQVDDNLARSFEGSGLGLVISKEFVELMKGKLWFESQVGIGTKFFIEIPFGKV